jgi:hypothetical protein
MRHSIALLGLRHCEQIVTHARNTDCGSRRVYIRCNLLQLAGVKVPTNRNDYD